VKTFRFFCKNPRTSSSSGQDEESRRHDGNDDGKSSSTRKDSKYLPINQNENKSKLISKINVFKDRRKSLKNRNIFVVKRSKNVSQALNLPKVLNLNPRSSMNKLEELKTFI
jgi:hypothetical protein